MDSPIFLVIIYMLLKSIRITQAKTNPESNLSEGINAILLQSPKNSENNTSEPHLIINIHMNPSIDLNNAEDSWILDEVYDPTKRSISKIISPYLIVVGRGEPVVMYPLQYKETIKHQEFRKEQATEDDKPPKGSPSSKSGEPGPSINIKEREEVKDVQGSPFGKAVEANPAIIIKSHDKDVQDSSSDKNKEPRPLINMNERADKQATKDEARDAQDAHSINMKERKDEQPTKDDAKSRHGIQSSKTMEPIPLMKGIDDKNGQGRPSISNIIGHEQATEDDVKSSQSSLSSNTNELNPLIYSKESEDDGVESSPSGQKNEPGPSKHLNEREDKQPIGDDVKESQFSKTNNLRNLIYIKEQEGVEEVQSAPSGETKEPLSTINMEKHDGSKDLKGSPPGKRNDINLKEIDYEQPIKDDVKNLQDLPSRNESESDALRMKRNQGLVFSSKKSVGFNIAFLKKIPSKSKTWNPQEPFFTQNDISSLGLIEIKDPSLKKDRIESPKELEIVQSKNQKNNKNKDEKNNLLRSYQFYKPELDLSKIKQIKKDPEVPVYNMNNWNNQPLNKNSKKNFYQEGKDNDYHLKSESHQDSITEKDFTLFDQTDQGDKRKHILDEIKNYKPSFKMLELKESHPKAIDSYSKENDFSTRSQSLQSFPHEREQYHHFNSKDIIKSPINDDEQKTVQDMFRLPYNTLLDSDNASDIKKDYRYDFKKPLNLPTDLKNINGGYYNAKTAEDSIYTKNYPQEERILEQNIKNKYYNTKTAVNSIYSGNILPQGKVPEEANNNEYYNGKTAENNIYTENYPSEERIREENIKNKYFSGNYLLPISDNEIQNKYYNGKPTENNIFSGSYLAKEKVSDRGRLYEDNNAKKAENNFNIENYVPQQIFQEHGKNTDYYNAKTENNIYKEDYLPQKSVPDKEKPSANTFFINKYLPQGRVPENVNPTENLYKGSDLLQDKVSEHATKNEFYNDKTAESNIYNENYLPQERVPDLHRKPDYYNDKPSANTFFIKKYLPQGRVPEHDKVSEHDRKSEFYNAKTAENNIYKDNDLPQERVSDLKGKYNYFNNFAGNENFCIKKYLPKERVSEDASPSENIYKGSDLLLEKVPEHDRKSEYYNAKTTENIYQGNDQPQERVSDLDRKYDYNNDKTRNYDIFIKKYLPQDKVHEQANPFENIYKGSDLLQEKVPEHDRKSEYYNAKTTENIYQGNDQPQERGTDLDRKYDYNKDRTRNYNIFIKKYLPQDKVPEHANPSENIYKVSDLSQEKVPEHDRKSEYYNAKTTENIYQGNDQPQERVPKHEIKNEYYNGKTAENNIHSEIDSTKERLPAYDKQNEYYNANIYKESDFSKEKLPEYDRKNEYYAKTSDSSISNENELPQERVPEHDQKNKSYNVQNIENIYKASDLPQEGVPKHEIINGQYIAKSAENIIYIKNDLPDKTVPEYNRKPEYNNAKTTENIYKESDIKQQRNPELDRKNEYYNVRDTENTYKESDLPQKSYNILDWKNKYYNEKTSKNSFKEKDLLRGITLEQDITNKYYNAKAAQNNIYKGYDLKGPNDNIKNIYYNSETAENITRLNSPSSREREKFNFNEPMKSFSGIDDVKYKKKYDQLRFNPYASSFRNSSGYSLAQKDIDSIISQHMRESLQKKNIYKNDQTFDGKNYMPNNITPEDPENMYILKNGQRINSKCSKSMPTNLNPTDLYSDLGPSSLYSKFPQKNPFSSYSKTNSFGYIPRSYRRTRRSSSPRQNIRNKCAAQYINDPNPQKGFNLQKMEENGEVPCDTCGGKNKKKGDKPPTIFCSALTDQKSPESKIEDSNAQGKLNDVIPCDTCGGKNKKIGGKTLPGGLDSEIRRVKMEVGQKLTPEDMIPCEKCKVNRDGNLASQSCGCISNPSICSCEGSKLSRAPDQSQRDLNYGVFNMNDPIPYLTTQLRVFRRRHNTWWRIVPIVTVDSVSGIFANKNMSMIFSTRVGTLRQEKSARFLDHKLVIPLPNDDQLAETKSLDALTELQNNIGKGFLIGSCRKDVSIREITNSEQDAIKSIDSLGYFPVSINALQMCPHNDKNICLNIRGERVPEFSIKVKIPFRENSFMMRDKHVVKISNIITDATTKDALHITIDVINKGLEAHEYSIFVYNCPLSKSALSSTSVRRQLQPDIGQTVTFLLPFINGAKKNKKFSCDVVVKESDSKNSNRSFFLKTADVKDGIISKRPMDIMVHSRCFCIARCRCHCMEKLQTFINYKICERMSRRSEEEAGLIYNCPPGNEINDVCITDLLSGSHKTTSFNIFYQIQCIVLILLIWLLIFGLLKAIFGLCIQSIDKWGFETVQPGRYYAYTSRIRIFIVNVFFFIIYPFTYWCKCFQPKPEDLMAASTDWSCNHEIDDDDGSLSGNKGSKKSRLCGGGHENLLLAFTPYYENGLFKDDKPDDEESTAFILEVLEESKTSLSRMMCQSIKSADSPQIVSKATENSEEERAAEEMVDNLKTSQRAYRIMNSPVGGVINIPENCQYCVKGFFLPTLKGTYEFFSYHPLVQYISVSKENEVVKLKKPEYLHTDEFSRNYANKLEVLKAGDLSVGCPPNVPCINITPLNDLEGSFVKLSGLLKEKHNDLGKP